MDTRDGFPTSLPDFQKEFPDDGACLAYLERAKWPDGFTCPSCGVCREPYRTKGRPLVLRCRACSANAGVTAGTVMAGTHTPLSIWFWGAYLITAHTPGESARQFQKQLGLSRYETAFQILHKLRAGMVRPERDAIGADHPVEVDETLIGGKTKGEGRGVHHKTLVVGAVEVRNKAVKKHRAKSDRLTFAGRLRLTAVENRTTKVLAGFVESNVVKGAVVRTDGLARYDGLREQGYRHDGIPIRGDHVLTETHLHTIHVAFSNLKTWLLGTHHSVSQGHLQAYLNEYVFRFNRRFYPGPCFHSLLGLAAHSTAPTYKQLYSGEWQHPST